MPGVTRIRSPGTALAMAGPISAKVWPGPTRSTLPAAASGPRNPSPTNVRIDLEVNRFPKNAVLERELAYVVKKRGAELLAALQSRLAKERDPAGNPGDLEREFSPHATYLDPGGESATGYLLHSFHAFHAPVARAIRDAAYEVVLAELGK